MIDKYKEFYWTKLSNENDLDRISNILRNDKTTFSSTLDIFDIFMSRHIKSLPVSPDWATVFVVHRRQIPS